MDEIGTFGAGDHCEVDAHRLDCCIRRTQLGQIGIRERPLFLARRAEAVHAHLHVTTVAQRADQFGHMHPRASIDRRWVLLAQNVDAHL